MKAGKIPDVEKIDSTFFGMDDIEADQMDPQYKICHEATFEAIIDAGIDPINLRNNRTGMFIGYCYNDAKFAQSQEDPLSSNYKWNADFSEVSRRLGFTGPCITYDSACASTSSALNEAVHAIRSNVIDIAIVSGVAIATNPNIATGFRQLGMTNDEGKCRCMDKKASGYVR